MCNIVKANEDVKPFDISQIENIAINLRKIGAGVILLTGGEPFLRSDIPEIVKVFKKNGLDVRLQTAGLGKTWPKIVECVKNGARDINVSLDTLDEELGDYINGVKNSWREAVKTISFISRIFPSRDSICALGCVLSPYNIDEIEAILDFATKIGWWLSLVPAHISDRKETLKIENFRGYDETFLFNENDYPKLKVLIERLKSKKKEGYNLFDSDDYLDSIYYFVTTGSPNWRKNNICDTPNLYFAILPDGRFAPCCDFRLKRDIYLYDKNFPEIYKSKEFRSEVKEIAKKCRGCNFGSFPEMTLSARSFNTIKERIILQLKAKSKGLKPIDEKRIFEIIEEIRNKYKDIYTRSRLQRIINQK